MQEREGVRPPPVQQEVLQRRLSTVRQGLRQKSAVRQAQVHLHLPPWTVLPVPTIGQGPLPLRPHFLFGALRKAEEGQTSQMLP